MSTVQIICVYY